MVREGDHPIFYIFTKDTCIVELWLKQENTSWSTERSFYRTIPVNRPWKDKHRVWKNHCYKVMALIVWRNVLIIKVEVLHVCVTSTTMLRFGASNYSAHTYIKNRRNELLTIIAGKSITKCFARLKNQKAFQWSGYSSLHNWKLSFKYRSVSVGDSLKVRKPNWTIDFIESM